MPALSRKDIADIIRPMMARLATAAFPPMHTVWEHNSDGAAKVQGWMIYRAASQLSNTPVVVWLDGSDDKLSLTLQYCVGPDEELLTSIVPTTETDFADLEKKFGRALTYP